MKQTILLSYQAVVILVMLTLAGYFISLGKAPFAAIYVLLALGGVLAARNEYKHRQVRKIENK